MTKEFEIARLHMVGLARAGQIDRVRGYAWARRIYPFNPYDLEETFEADFKIGRNQSERVLVAIDNGWRNNNPISFSDLEGFGGSDSGLGRMEIVHVCRLAFLDGRFDDTVWEALTVPGSGPIESQGLAGPFAMENDINF
jgi:hypothetical protein